MKILDDCKNTRRNMTDSFFNNVNAEISVETNNF